MFGYIVIHGPELKIKDEQRYKSVYCGLCQTLKQKYGHLGQLCLNNDMTFMALLHMSLYEDEMEIKERAYRCKLHPLKKKQIYEHPALEYAADMTLVLSHYLARDHWKDDQKPSAWLEMVLTRKKVKKIESVYPRQVKAVKNYVYRLEAAEHRNEQDLDKLAGLTGMMLAELFNWREDLWTSMLKKVGFYLGKFIYLMDAYEDVEDDIKKGRFNPLKDRIEDADFDDQLYALLDMMMADCARNFEKLPLTKDVEILRNILYAGVWSKYIKVRSERHKTEEVTDESL